MTTPGQRSMFDANSILLRVPPPLWFIVTFAAGFELDRIVPWVPAWMAGMVPRAAGLLLMIVSGVLALLAFLCFRRRRTTVLPWKQPAALIRSGPFAFSRNPLYLSLTLLTMGGALLGGLPWVLLLVPLPVAMLDRVVIPFEEMQLRRTLGGDYDAYCLKVRRWL
jgi:protein-S-isoprenylcysteine O-methyltransferase Ste14